MTGNLAIISGSLPPMRCGVGDYAYNLSLAISTKGARVYVYTLAGQGPGPRRPFPGWGLAAVARRFPGFLRELAADGVGWVNIQYPSIGYGYRLGPQLLVFLLRFFSPVKVVSTLHEFKRARFLRKASLIPFILFSHKLVFTARTELEAVRRWLPIRLLGGPPEAAVIPVGSNIPAIIPGAVEKRRWFIVFFGLFYPGRQAELVAEACGRISGAHKDAVFGIIGDIHPKHQGYYRSLRGHFEKSVPAGRLEWHIGESPEAIAKILSAASVALLPYPDGASFRRTTLMAAMMSGVPVVSTRGPDTPAAFKDGENVLFAGDAAALAEKTLLLLSDGALAAGIASGGLRLSRDFSWERIAAGYLEFFAGGKSGAQ